VELWKSRLIGGIVEISSHWWNCGNLVSLVELWKSRKYLFYSGAWSWSIGGRINVVQNILHQMRDQRVGDVRP